ncbi:unannotated protein [freshwater metagenome]|uniref:Unannotated protein n=1 Tax=freshwater metagenome TaxID=449393 RepID=A0A6J7RRQ9_9ZZZZ
MPPSTSKTRPVTAADSAEPNQTTSGETFAGSIASKAPSSASAIMSLKASSVIRVRAAGASALAVTPIRPSSAACTKVRLAIAPLAAE